MRDFRNRFRSRIKPTPSEIALKLGTASIPRIFVAFAADQEVALQFRTWSDTGIAMQQYDVIPQLVSAVQEFADGGQSLTVGEVCLMAGLLSRTPQAGDRVGGIE